MDARRRRRLAQATTIAAAAAPAAALAARAWLGDLGANPIESITHTTGDWTLRLLLASLAITPARRLLGLSWLAPLRRTLGLAAFGYAVLHLLTYVALDQFFDWQALWEDVQERRYVAAGFTGFLCLLPLALTSTRGWKRRLGPRWASLHRLAYAAGACGVVHYAWLVKGDRIEPFAYGTVLAALLGARLVLRIRRSAAGRALRRGPARQASGVS